jgi:hypothetical protein
MRPFIKRQTRGFCKRKSPTKLHFRRDRPGHEADFILEQNGKVVVREIKAGSTVTRSNTVGIRESRDSLKQNRSLVCSVVSHAGQSRSRTLT